MESTGPSNPRTCQYQQCGRPAYARHMCRAHYDRWRFGRPMDTPIKTADLGRRTCELPGCDGDHYGLGLCRPHYRVEWAGRDPMSLRRRPWTKPTPDHPPAA